MVTQLMSKWRCLPVCLILVFGQFLAFNAWAAGRSNEIIAFGDSITQGQGEVSAPPQGARVGGYEPDFEALSDARNDHYNVYNYGIGGERTWEGDQRFNWVMSQHPSAKQVLLLEGTNDYWAGVAREDTVWYLARMIDKARVYGIEPVIGTLTPDPRSVAQAKNIPLYNTLIKAMAADKNVVVADLYAEMVTGWNAVYTDDDPLHPNRAGYVKMAEVWFSAVFPCSSEYLDQCFAASECFAVGGYWFGGMCNLLPPPLSGVHLLLRP